MRTLRAGLAAFPLIFVASPVPAGLWDDVKAVVSEASDTVDDVKSTRDEAKDTVGDAKGVVKDTSDDVGVVLPERKRQSPTPSTSPPTPTSAPPPPPSASPPPPPSARKWHVDSGGGQTREVNEAELAKMIRSGTVSSDTYVYAASLSDWTRAGEVADLKRYFSK